MSEKNPKPSETIDKSSVSTEAADPGTAWTIMLYLAGDNNLADECVFALTQIKEVDTDKRVRVVAQLDPTGRRVRTRRFIINKALKDGKPESNALLKGAELNGKKRRKVIEDALPDDNPLPEGTVKFSDQVVRGAAKPVENIDPDSGDPKVLFDFISWSVENFPADHYMLVLSGHGGGAIEQEFLFDETSKGRMTIAQLGNVLGKVHGRLKNKKGEQLEIDIVGMDSCLMSMAEVAHQLRGSVKFMISSESFGPQAGWPYGRIIERLNERLAAGDADISPKDLGLITIDEHVDFYTDYAAADGLSVDISMMDVERAEDLTKAVHDFAEVLKAELAHGRNLKTRKDPEPSDFLDQIVLAHWEAQSYNGEVYVDLRDFCDCLKQRYNPKDIKQVATTDPAVTADINEKIQRRTKVETACDAVIAAVDSLVEKSCYMGVDFQYSNGASIYFPWAEVDSDYNGDELSFVTASGWKDFLDRYVEITRRPPRNFKAGQREVIRLDRVRKTVTDQKGPANLLIRSMRNPPINVVEEGLSDCTKERNGLS
jgi:hypothetical protein